MACVGAQFSRWVACAAWFSTGCVSYTATIDREVRRGDLQMHLESATVVRTALDLRPRETRLTLTFEQVPADVTLVDARISRNGDPLCLPGSLPANDARVLERSIDVHFAEAAHVSRAQPPAGRSEGRWATAPLEANERLTLGFPFGFDVVTDESPRLDLLLQTPDEHLRCVPVPLTDDGRPLRWKTGEHLALGYAVEIEGLTRSLGSVTQVAGVPLIVGWWLGSYRAEVAAGVALAGCPTTRCPVMSKDSGINNSTTFVIAPGVGRAFFEGSVFSVGATVRYRVVRLIADTFHGQEQLWMHGPILIPYVGLVPKVTAGGVGGARESLVGIEFPVGYAFVENGDRAVSLGFGLTWVGTVL
jgi:hypothetical protein